MFALGNEIPPGVVRWHGRLARRALPARARTTRPRTPRPTACFTYVNFPPTEFLDLSFFDVCAFNVYLHREADLRAYLARLQHIAGHKPLLLAEAGRRQHPRRRRTVRPRSPRCTCAPRSRKAPAARSPSRGPTNGGAAAIDVDDWAFGLVDRAAPRRSRRRRPSRRPSPTRRFPPRRGSSVAARLGRRLRLQRGRHARRLPRRRSSG